MIPSGMIADPQRVAQVVVRYDNWTTFAPDLLCRYDNLRPDYSKAKTLEFGGIAVTEDGILDMVRAQALRLRQLRPDASRFIIYWCAESARKYAHSLRQELGALASVPVDLYAIRTHWESVGAASVCECLSASAGRRDPRAVVLLADFMVGSGATFQALRLELQKRDIPPDFCIVLVNNTAEARIQEDISLFEPCFEFASRHWLIGYNADCLSKGQERGRGIPFLGFLVPEGKGIRDALRTILGTGATCGR